MDEQEQEHDNAEPSLSSQALTTARYYAAQTSDFIFASAFHALDRLMSSGEALPEEWAAKGTRAGRPASRTVILDDVEHGLACYAQGCGCATGRRANTERARRYRESKREQASNAEERS